MRQAGAGRGHGVRPEANPYPGRRSAPRYAASRYAAPTYAAPPSAAKPNPAPLTVAPLYAAPWSVSRRPVGPDDPPGQPKIDSGPREAIPAARPFHPVSPGPPSRWQAPLVALLALLLALPIGLALMWRKLSGPGDRRGAPGLPSTRGSRGTRATRWTVGLVAIALAVVATVTFGVPTGRPARVAAVPQLTARATVALDAGSSLTQAAPLLGAASIPIAPSTSGQAGSASGSPLPTAPMVVRDARPSGVDLAVAQLASLRIAPRSYDKPYQRAQFGQSWADVDHNGCDTRNDILRRDLVAVTLKAGTRGCVVATGTLHDPYSGAVLNFVRGGPVRIEIDHVVSLADAWHTGALSWTDAQRLAFANDPLELLAVSAALNQAKKDADAASWLPPSTGRRCTFVARQVAIKARFQLWVTPAEHDAIARVLRACGAPPATKASAKVPVRSPASAKAPAKASASAKAPAQAPSKPLAAKPSAPAAAPPTPAAPRPPAPAPGPTQPAPTSPNPARDLRGLPLVNAGAFCLFPGAFGATADGRLMRCAWSFSDFRYRWRAA